MARAFRFLRRTLFCLILAVLAILLAFRINAFLQERDTAQELKPENGRFVETTEGTLHVSLWGEETAKPVLMTHGMAAWGGLWEETARALAANGYRVIAVDQPPFGLSERADQDFSRTKQAARIAALADALRLEGYILVGHSYGGGVAMETALRAPKRIAGLVLVAPVLTLAAEGAQVTTNPVPLPLRVGWLGEVLVSLTVTNPLLTGTLVKLFMHEKNALTPRHVEILQAPLTRHGNTPGMTAWLQQFLADDPEALSRDRAKLGALALPVSLIWGEQDTVTPIAQAKDLAGIIELQSFHGMPETGHMPQLERPDAFNKVLLEVLSAVE